MVKPKCTVCNTSSSSVFHLNVIGKGRIKVCPSCNKLRVNAENKELDKLDTHEEKALFDTRTFNKEYYAKKV